MARPSATDRLGRILSMVPWIASQDGPLISEVCARFDISRDELLADLNVVFLVGLYPYTPESLIEVDVDDDRVQISYTNFFERPLRLSRDEALALLAAGVASRSQPGHDPEGPLARGLDKVAAVLGIDLDDDLGVVVADQAIEELEIVDAAIADDRVLHIGYFSHARNESTVRDIEPLRRFATDGAWYLDAFCRSSGDHRVFRVDRITAVETTDDHFERTDPRTSLAAFEPARSLDRVTIEIPPSAGWVIDQYPHEAVEDVADGRRRVTLAVSARPWLERLLLRIGPDAQVVSGPDDLRDAGAQAARRILQRYSS
ncbi:MAG: helix-turn-helix transcriptional regulator [Acidimicrobiales bacterium]